MASMFDSHVLQTLLGACVWTCACMCVFAIWCSLVSIYHNNLVPLRILIVIWLVSVLVITNSISINTLCVSFGICVFRKLQVTHLKLTSYFVTAPSSNIVRGLVKGTAKYILTGEEESLRFTKSRIMLLSTKLFLFILTNSRIWPERQEFGMEMEKLFPVFFFGVFFLKLRGRENRILRIQNNINLSRFPHHGQGTHVAKGEGLPRTPLGTGHPGIPGQMDSSLLPGPQRANCTTGIGTTGPYVWGVWMECGCRGRACAQMCTEDPRAGGCNQRW